MGINILILAAEPTGQSSQEKKYPPCLTEHNGRSVLEFIFENICDIERSNIFCALRKYHIEKFHLDNIVKVIFKNVNIVSVPESTMGSACTSLYVSSQIDQTLPLLIISSNEIIKTNFKDVLEFFDKRECDGGLLTFSSLHPRYSYIRLNEQQEIIEVTQQNPISKHATTGTFWYRNTEEFVEAAKSTIRKGVMTSGRYYVAPVFNQMILKHQKIGYFPIRSEDYIPLKQEDEPFFKKSSDRVSV